MVQSDGADQNKMHTLRKRRSSEKRKESNGNTKLKMQELWEMFPRKLLKARPHKWRQKKSRGSNPSQKAKKDREAPAFTAQSKP